MANANYVLPAPETVTMTGEAARKLIGSGSGDAALVYLFILQSGGRYDAADCALHTGRSEEKIEAAYAVLENLGLVTRRAPAAAAELPAELPQYTTEEISRELKNGETFRRLVDEISRIVGRPLSGDELTKLFGFYDYLALPPEVIVLLVRTLVQENLRRSKRVPSMRYIEKAAFSWHREGLFSLEAAEKYLESREKRRSAHGEVAAAMGVADRQLSETEKKYVDEWLGLGFGAKAIAIAADRAITQTGRRGMKYMNGILSNWHRKGLHTPEEIESGDTYDGPRRGAEKPSSAPPQNTEVTRSDAEKNREALRRIREG